MMCVMLLLVTQLIGTIGESKGRNFNCYEFGVSYALFYFVTTFLQNRIKVCRGWSALGLGFRKHKIQPESIQL